MNTKDLRIDPIPAGVYYIGDPCYPFSTGDGWDEILEESDYFDKPMIMYKGHADERDQFEDCEFDETDEY